MSKVWRYWKVITGTVVGVCLIAFYFSLPDPLFEDPYSTVLEDRSGNLLSASIANDGQWRFPLQQNVPEKFKVAIVQFEDKRFYSHWGVDVLALGRAIRQNLKAGKIVSGGSTLTMQVMRLARKNHSRTFFQKGIETLLALRLEFAFSKDEILSYYASHAPFGGNVVGIEAAAWRYFGRRLDQLSWAEACMLAVLPNNPSLIHLGRNRDGLRDKRDRLLLRLKESGKIDEITYELSISEPLPQNPHPLPQRARHLLVRAKSEGYDQMKIHSTVDERVQIQSERVINDHFQRISGNQIFNAAAIILSVQSGEVIAYVGNTNAGGEHGEMVDIVTAPRSTGSILKPFLYAAMMDEGGLLPATLVPDVPTVIAGFSPKNFSREYDGAVPADQALIRSLNIPAVLELKEYQYEKFYNLLKNVGLSTLTREADHYGLSLVLGGAEGTLWDITGAYASMARTLNSYFTRPGSRRYDKNDFHPPHYSYDDEKNDQVELSESSWLSASAIWLTFETLKELYRPGEETGWQHFTSTKPVAWKTGTSFGFRDGWAVGTSTDYAVGVWVGNADGEGRPGLTGTEMAAPILFDLFALLPGQSWFQKPDAELTEIEVCEKSGQRLSSFCEGSVLKKVTQAGLASLSCEFHQRIHLTADERFRVNLNCEPSNKVHAANWFVLPPVQEYYYRSKNITYRPLPPTRVDCAAGSLVAMDLVYPKQASEIFIPRELDGSPGRTLFQVAHRSSGSTVYWHLDGDYIGATKKTHHLSLTADIGNHTLTLVDNEGQILTQSFRILASP